MTKTSASPNSSPDRATLARRDILTGTAAAMVAATAAPRLLDIREAAAATPFKELTHGIDEWHHVAEGFRADVLVRWGDPLFADAPALDIGNLTGDAQLKQFGYNCDFIAYFPLPKGSARSDHGLLCINHEYTNADLMFADVRGATPYPAPTRRHMEVQMAAHGHSVVEVKRNDAGSWGYVQDSRYNRRITAWETAMILSGPAAGHARLKTTDDPTGRSVIGTFNNCAGGQTPWGTCLMAEENVHYYFTGDPRGTDEAGNHLELGITRELRYEWGRFLDRFNVEKEPHEPNRFGWVVEYDPYDPSSVPVKRTALGRFRHEGATSAVSKDGRVAIYSGDDQLFQYVYKFVSARAFDPENPEANRNLLDDGTLYVARFEEDGRVRWLPLVWGTGPLTPANGFADQAGVLIETRRAATFAGATPMDRPEDVEANPVTGAVYVALTKNPFRRSYQADAANPRARNRAGHIIEMLPPGGNDHAAETFTWNVFLMAGDPSDAAAGAMYHADVSANGWFANPDNLAFDPMGRMWIATDGAPDFDTADGLWTTEVEGPRRALTRYFFKCPVDAEMTGPCFTPDGETLFASVQHPGQGSDFANPSTRWPDFDPDMPPRPSVVAITRDGGGPIA